MSAIAIISGSGDLILPGLEDSTAQPQDTPYGAASAPLQTASINGQDVVLIKRHGLDHQFAPHQVNYRANLWLLARQQCKAVIAIQTVGAIAADLQAGDLIVPEQIIDYTWGREHTFSELGDVRHVEFSYPYDASLRTALIAAAQRCGQNVIDHGTYGATQGPRLESVAEIDRLARDGCSIVGMTVMPEAGLARELDLPYASLCLAVNPAAGRDGGQPIDMADLRRVSNRGMARVTSLLLSFLQGLETTEQIGG